MIVEKSEKLTTLMVNLNKNDKDSHQLVYASQLYGTFFAVGARLSIDGNNLTGIELALNNYKGLYNVGLMSSTRTTWRIDERTGVIVLHLKVDNGQNNEELTRSVTMELPSAISFDNLDALYITRVLHPMSNASAVHHLDENIFDSEFYTRNGAYISAIHRLDNYLPNDPNPLAGWTGQGQACMSTRAKFI